MNTACTSMDAAADAAARDVPRKRRVTVRVVARIGSPFTVELASEDSRVSVRAEGPVVEKARTKAVTSEDLIEHVGRMFDIAHSALRQVCQLGFCCTFRAECALIPFDAAPFSGGWSQSATLGP